MSRERALRLLLDLFAAGVDAVRPDQAVRKALRRRNEVFTALIATGKAAPGMARSALAVLGPLPTLIVSDHAEPIPGGARLVVSSHPVPDERSLEAGRAVLEICEGLEASDRLLYLLSGGTSALVESPRQGLALEDLVATTAALLAAGATIHELNAVRTALSTVKGGGIAIAAAPAEIVTLAISDVVDDDLTVIGSGPTTHPGDIDPRDVVGRYGLGEDLPAAILGALDRADRRPVPPTGRYEIIANGREASAAVVAEAHRRGLAAAAAPTRLAGPAADQARRAIAAFRASPDLDVLAFVGETTVIVSGSGSGGRNQEAALAAAIDLDQTDDIAFLAAGTDGIDGPTAAAGGIVDGTTAERGRGLGLDADRALCDNDSGNWLDAVGARVVTGPTGTNVGDLWILVRSDALDGDIA